MCRPKQKAALRRQRGDFIRNQSQEKNGRISLLDSNKVICVSDVWWGLTSYYTLRRKKQQQGSAYPDVKYAETLPSAGNANNDDLSMIPLFTIAG